MSRVFIDTELWVYSLKRPDEHKYPDPAQFQQALTKHLAAKAFFRGLPADTQYFFSIHQLCEIYHVLCFRGTRLDLSFTSRFLKSLTSSRFTSIVEITRVVYDKCVRHSVNSSIHIWDYLCVVPLLGKIDLIHTSDKHYMHASFTSLGIPIQNPLTEWEVL